MICNKCNHKLPDDSEFCQYCGNKIETGFVFARPKMPKSNNKGSKSYTSNTIRKTCLNKKFVLFTSITTIVLSIISMFSIIIAMNVQSVYRNIYEPLDPTVLYFLLFDIYLTYIIYIILSNFIKKEKNSILQYIVGFVPALFSIGALIEGSLFSDTYFVNGRSYNYVNNEILYIINIIWVIVSFLILIINLPPLLVVFRDKLYQSVRYREHCYKRVGKMKDYLDNGIISKEEFERNKQRILKNIKM